MTDQPAAMREQTETPQACMCGHGEGVHRNTHTGEPKQHRDDCNKCACERFRPREPAEEPGALVKEHDLKIWPMYFYAVRDGSKAFEVRRNDRGFKVGDVLRLREWVPIEDGIGDYTGREVLRRVTYILPYGVDVVMSLASLSAERETKRTKSSQDKA